MATFSQPIIDNNFNGKTVKNVISGHSTSGDRLLRINFTDGTSLEIEEIGQAGDFRYKQKSIPD